MPLPLGYEDMEPPSGADPDHPPYEGGAAAVRGGVASGAGVEPTGAWFRAMLGCRQPTRKRYAGRDSNPQTARFELASVAELALPARTPPRIRTETLRIKSPQL